MPNTLSVAMIAMNEEANLARTLETVKWADEIVVVDSGSGDRTIEIAQSYGAKTSYHAFGGHGEQKNVALDLCTMDGSCSSTPTSRLRRNSRKRSRPSSPASPNTLPTGFRAST